jgi:hypothetical protein
VIVFDLKCGSSGHVFEAWFGSTEDFDDQGRRGLVECPLCGSQDITKAVMSPRVGAKGNRAVGVGAPKLVATESDEVKTMLAELARAQRRILERSDYVGNRFADEARAIHLGEAAVRSIYGQATKAETESLLEEGIPVAPLPLPVVAPRDEN